MEKPPLPFVLYAAVYQMEAASGATRGRIVRDYEISLFDRDGGSICLDGVVYPISAGMLMLRKPGQTVSSAPPYLCELVHLDLTGEFLRRRGRDGLMDGRIQSLCAHPCVRDMPPFFRAGDLDAYHKILFDIRSLLMGAPEPDEMLLCAKALELLARMRADAASDGAKGASDAESAKKRIVSAALVWMERHYREPITLRDIGRAAALSPNYLHRIFKEVTGVTPLAALTRMRLDAARALLLTTERAVCDIAGDLGFDGGSYFIQVFRRATGVTPGEFRRLARVGTAESEGSSKNRKSTENIH